MALMDSATLNRFRSRYVDVLMALAEQSHGDQRERYLDRLEAMLWPPADPQVIKQQPALRRSGHPTGLGWVAWASGSPGSALTGAGVLGGLHRP